MTHCSLDPEGQSVAPFRLLFFSGIPLLGLILVASACTSLQAATPPLVTGATRQGLTATPTSTPISPDIGTPDPDPQGPPWGVYASPEVTPASTLVPTPVDPLVIPSGEVNILLFGSDAGPTRFGYRTDGIVLLTLNPNGAVSLTSFPRDLYVYIPGWRMQRLNAAQPWGGFETTCDTFVYNFGVRPDYFITISFEGFVAIVDSLGGVDVNVGKTFSDARDGHPKGFTVYAGTVHMDGETALWYVRARETTSDLDRERRMEELLLAIGHSLLSANGLARVPELYEIYQGKVSTNISLEAAVQLLPLLQKSDPEQVHRYTIGLDEIAQWTEPLSGAYYYIPKPGAIQQTLEEALNTP
jgi:polyisoprenyl-teichoic acid--peptidoglycan teichoic acid transferase